MRKTILGLFLVIFCMGMVCCGCNKKVEKVDISDEAVEAYKLVLTERKKVINTINENTSCYLREIRLCKDIKIDEAQFSVLDLDGDGNVEILLELNGDEKCIEVLHYEGKSVYAHQFSERDMMNIKEDGTFEYYTASEEGCVLIKFEKDKYGLDYLSRQIEKNNIIKYYIANEEKTNLEYIDYIDKQREKADIEWYLMTEDNIDKYIEY